MDRVFEAENHWMPVCSLLKPAEISRLPGLRNGCRSIVRGLLPALFAIAATTAGSVAGPSPYVASGVGDLKYFPDTAHIGFPVWVQSDDPSDVVGHVKDRTRGIVEILKAAGVDEGDIDVDGDESVVKSPGNLGQPSFVSVQFLFVTVHDFSSLPTIVKTISDSGVINWSVSYSEFDKSKLAPAAVAVALEDAEKKAGLHARGRGRGLGPMLKVVHFRICFPTIDDPKGDCLTDTGKTGTKEIVMTARRITGPRTDFTIPKPDQRTVTATVSALFEMR